MNQNSALSHADLCEAIKAAIRVAESMEDTLVSALLTEALEAAACR